MTDSEEEGTRHFMVNVIEPQFNLHSEEANVSSWILAETGPMRLRFSGAFVVFVKRSHHMLCI